MTTKRAPVGSRRTEMAMGTRIKASINSTTPLLPTFPAAMGFVPEATFWRCSLSISASK